MQLLSITNTEFTHKYLRGLTVSLQEDIVQAVSESKTLTSSLKENVDSVSGLKQFQLCVAAEDL